MDAQNALVIIFSVLFWVLFISFIRSGNKSKSVTPMPIEPPRGISRPTYYTPTVDPEVKRKRYNWVKEQEDFLISHSTVWHLLDRKKVLNIGYSDLLSCVDWKLKRLKILVRDGFACQGCNEKRANLHVHHNYYLKDQLPWEIEDSALVSLCYKCHKKRHDAGKMPVYEWRYGQKVLTSNSNVYCSRCNGAGHFPQYNHVYEGKCFRCDGNCIDSTIFSKPLNEIQAGSRLNSSDKLLNDCIVFLSSITVQEFKDKVAHVYTETPVQSGSSRSNTPTASASPSFNDVADDLPF